ncbi:hypothetical protein SAMN04487919_101461 [Bacillus sp. ok061]|nr:hypothetical protein [Bacillus sp. ok061]SEF52243.1 hypothetical protein SAMN04487919_101461 [Bacillus sp. ok061]
MKKAVLSLMGFITVLSLTIGITNVDKAQKSYEVIQYMSVGDHGG